MFVFMMEKVFIENLIYFHVIAVCLVLVNSAVKTVLLLWLMDLVFLFLKEWNFVFLYCHV